MSSKEPNWTVVQAGPVVGAVVGDSVLNATVNCGRANAVGGVLAESLKLSTCNPVRANSKSLAAPSSTGIFCGLIICQPLPVFCSTIVSFGRVIVTCLIWSEVVEIKVFLRYAAEPFSSFALTSAGII